MEGGPYNNSVYVCIGSFEDVDYVDEREKLQVQLNKRFYKFEYSENKKILEVHVDG